MAAIVYHVVVLFFISIFNLSSCYDVLKGSVTCLDCNTNNNHISDLSGIKISVKCVGEKRLAMATTKQDGTFETNLPTSSSSSPTTTTTNVVINCSSKILGATTRQLYIPNRFSESKILKDSNNNLYTTSEPLRFYTKCPIMDNEKCHVNNNIGGSKTVDLPLPREWGLPPTSYYVIPFIPIIGIP